MTSLNHKRQQGATLLVALVMLLILTVLAVSSMRGVLLESRITGNRAENLRLQTAADAALKEGEFRFFGPGYLRDKLEPNRVNCQKNNTLNLNGANKPCLLNIQVWTDVIAPDSDEETSSDRLKRFMLNPMDALQADGAATVAAGASTFVAWMPYRGLDPNDETQSDPRAYWNSYLIAASVRRVFAEPRVRLRDGRQRNLFLSRKWPGSGHTGRAIDNCQHLRRPE